MACLLGGVLATATSCSVSTVGNATQPEDLEVKVLIKLAEKSGFPPDEVNCPLPLPYEKGSQVDCLLMQDGQSIIITVTSQGISGGKHQFETQIANLP
jgi:hypothetical protein